MASPDKAPNAVGETKPKAYHVFTFDDVVRRLINYDYVEMLAASESNREGSFLDIARIYQVEHPTLADHLAQARSGAWPFDGDKYEQGEPTHVELVAEVLEDFLGRYVSPRNAALLLHLLVSEQSLSWITSPNTFVGAFPIYVTQHKRPSKRILGCAQGQLDRWTVHV